MKLQCSNSCACLFDILTVDLDCWNCHFLMYSLAYYVNIKLTCSLLRKTASDTVSSVLQCKYARKLQDVLAQVSKIKKKIWSLLKIIGVRKVTWTKFHTHLRSQRPNKMQHPFVSKGFTPLIVVMYLTGVMEVLAERINPYWRQYLDVWDEGTSTIVLM